MIKDANHVVRQVEQCKIVIAHRLRGQNGCGQGRGLNAHAGQDRDGRRQGRPGEPGEIMDSRHSGNGIAHCFFQLSQDDFSWWMFQLRIPQAVFPGPEQTRRIVSYRARQIKVKPFFRKGLSPLNGRTHCGFPFRIYPSCGRLLEKGRQGQRNPKITRLDC